MSGHHTIRKRRHLIQGVAPGIMALSNYRRSWLRSDVTAGLSLAAIALPVGIAYAALAAVILVSTVGLFDLADLRTLFRMSYREFLMSVTTTLGVLLLGVLPGVLLAVALSLVWLLSVGSRPKEGETPSGAVFQ